MALHPRVSRCRPVHAPRSRASLGAFLVLALVAAACRTPTAPPPPPTAAALLDAARAELAAGRPHPALARLDDASARPGAGGLERELALVRGKALLAIAEEAGNLDFYEDARLNLERAGEGDDPEALLLASRAATQSFAFEDALRLARRAVARLDAVPDALAPEALAALPEPPHATLGRAAYRLFTQAEDKDTERARELLAEAREAFYFRVGHDPEDPEPWLHLAWLHEWLGEAQEARGVLVRAVELAPRSARLHENLARVTRGLEADEEAGRRAVLRTYAEFRALRPELAEGHWYGALEQFELAVTRLQRGEDAAEEFRAAERAFRAARERDPALEEACVGYEIVCRNGIGRSLLAREAAPDVADDPARVAEVRAAAREAFLSMVELNPRGLEWSLPGRMEDGLNGLWLLADRYRIDGERDGDPGALGRAAELFDVLRGARPEDPWMANNAGFLHRDAAVLLEAEAREARDAGRPDAARALMAPARDHAERSYLAYLSAAALAPDEPRIQNDTGLVQVYYLATDLEAAEAYLRRAVALGERLAARPDLEDPDYVLEAWGDAHENLGFLELVHRGNPEDARTHFRRAAEIGPRDRPQIVDYLRDCDRAQRGDFDPTPYLWGLAPAPR